MMIGPHFVRWHARLVAGIAVRKGDTLPFKIPSRHTEPDPEEWHELIASWGVRERLGDDAPESTYEQTLCQESGFKG